MKGALQRVDLLLDHSIDETNVDVFRFERQVASWAKIDSRWLRHRCVASEVEFAGKLGGDARQHRAPPR